jgi:capsular exopolysaccharide synthesis family protein
MYNSDKQVMSSSKKYYHDLKINLLTTFQNDIKSIMFVGGSLGDGVSTTAIGFSESLAVGSLRGVVLIDGNLRNPYLHSRFQIDIDMPGLTNLLLEGGQPALVKIDKSNLYVITCGICRFDQDLFESPKFAQFMAEIRERFDYVIIDAPPVLSYPESLHIAAKTDAAIMVIRSGATRREIAKKAIGKIEEVGGKVIGVVLNRRKYFIPDSIYKFFFES